MRILYLLLIFICARLDVFADSDTIRIPLQRRYFHEKVDGQQKLCDKADGKADSYYRAGGNEEVNLRLTDALFRKVDDLQTWVEQNDEIPNNNEKIRYLGYLENVIKQFRLNTRKGELDPTDLPVLLENFQEIAKAQIAGINMASIIEATPYPIARISTDVFFDNPGYKESKNIVYKKFCFNNPDKILRTIRAYVNEPFADSLIVVATMRDPVQLYTYAQSYNSPEGKLINRNTNNVVKAVVRLSRTPNALLYFPFLDDLLSGKKSIDSIKTFIGDGHKGYDSVGYFKLLVQTEIDYSARLTQMKDTPIAMFGPNGLREALRVKALEHFVNPINTLHDLTNLNARMRAIDPLTPSELYYVIVMGENDIYTSSYKHTFNRMLQRMGTNPRGDSLLLSVNFDYFKKFIKMAANYNKLDTFLKSMPAASSQVLMKAFVANLDQGNNLEDATDVADSYSSITDVALQNTILGYVKQNEEEANISNNQKAKVIYGLLREIFLSADSTNKIDLTASLGIPSIYEIQNDALRDNKGRIIQQVFFYGDEDGKLHFPGFIGSFSSKEWKVIPKKEWYEINSLKGNVFIFVNRPLNNDSNLDDSAQIHLNKYLDTNGMQPSIVVHRGHSYWVPRTIDRMPGDAKIVVLGSCGGYKNLNQILEVSPDAHIISTKEIGTGQITQPIQNYLSSAMQAGNKLIWKDMWATLSKAFAKDPSREKRDSWDDYIPPYKNLAAIFIKAYNKKLEGM